MRARARTLLLALAGPAGAVWTWLAHLVPGLAIVCLLAYGAWLAWPPAGFLAAGTLLLADRVYGNARGERGR